MKKSIKLWGVLLLCLVMVSGCTSGKLVGGDEKSPEEGIKVLDIGLQAEYYGIGIKKDNNELKNQVNDFLKQMEKSGELKEIIDRNMNGGDAKLVESKELDKSRDQLVVATTLDFEPFEYGVEGKEYYGIDFEIVEKLADYMDKDLVLVITSFEAMFMSVEQGKTDICIGGISITDERKKIIDFSDPYYETDQLVAIKSDNRDFDEAKTAEDMVKIFRNKGTSVTIGVENLTTAQALCEGEGDEEGLGCNVKGYSDLQSALRALEDDECYCVIGDGDSVKRFANIINGR